MQQDDRLQAQRFYQLSEWLVGGGQPLSQWPFQKGSPSIVIGYARFSHQDR